MPRARIIWKYMHLLSDFNLACMSVFNPLPKHQQGLTEEQEKTCTWKDAIPEPVDE